MNQNNILDITEENFQEEVIRFSMKAPVILDCWAPWCIPCRTQSSTLVQVFRQSGEGFRLARLDTDEERDLAEKLNIKTLPTLLAFINSRAVASYSGPMSTENIQALVGRILPRSSNLLLEKGLSLLAQEDFPTAESALREYIDGNPDSSVGMLAYIRALLASGKGQQALTRINSFPHGPEYNDAQQLKPLAYAYQKMDLQEESGEGGYLEVIYQNGLGLARTGQITTALDGLIDLLSEQKNYHNGEVRKIVLALLEVLGDQHPEVRKYRNELSNILF